METVRIVKFRYRNILNNGHFERQDVLAIVPKLSNFCCPNALYAKEQTL